MTPFKSIDVLLDNGARHMMKNAVVKPSVPNALKPGTSDRFHAFAAFDIKGIHDLRASDGGAIYGFPGNNRKNFLILGIVNILGIALILATRDSIPLLGVALLALSNIGYILMRKGEREAKAQFDDDDGYAPPST